MRTWFITGASRGFGAHIVKAALAAGDAVIAAARDPRDLARRFDYHPNLLAVRLDVTNEAEIEHAVAEGLQRFGRIDILVNNAGYGLLGAVEEASPEEIEALFATNVFGVMAVVREVLPHMRRQRSGHIINVSAILFYEAFPGWGVYGATKFAVEGLSDALAKELQPLGIHVTVVEPGFFRTDFLDRASLKRTAQEIPAYNATVGAMRQFATGANYQQPGDPEQLAKAFLVIVNAKKPPLRLPLGRDTVERVVHKSRTGLYELTEWRELALSTDFKLD